MNMLFSRTLKHPIDSSGSNDVPLKEIKAPVQTWLPLSRVHKIFPNLPTGVLCKLVELPSHAPSKVIALVPNATSEQLGQFYAIVEECRCTHKAQIPVLESKVKDEILLGKFTESQVGQSQQDLNINILGEIKSTIDKIISDGSVNLIQPIGKKTISWSVTSMFLL